MEGEPAGNQAERKAREHSTVTLTEGTIIISKGISEVLQQSPHPDPASALTCSVTPAPCQWKRLRAPHHQSAGKLRSRTLAISTGTGCPKAPKKWQFPYLLLSSMEGEKKPFVRIKSFRTYGLQSINESFLILFGQDLSLCVCGLDDKRQRPPNLGTLRNRPGDVNEH